MLARVYNDNVCVYKNRFKGELITIPPGQFITLPRAEAVQLSRSFMIHPDTFDGAGVQKKESYSMLRVEVIKDPNAKESDEPQMIRCMATNKEFATQKEFLEHLLSDEKLMEANRAANEDANVPKNIPGTKRPNA